MANVYSGDFYWDNYACANIDGMERVKEIQLETTREDFDRRKPKTGILMSYVPDMLTPKNMSSFPNLHRLRVELAKSLMRDDLADVNGGKWPANSGVVPTESQFGIGDSSWYEEKIENLRKYRYAFCIENTLARYYVSEEIWQGVLAGCLPIYYGAAPSTIYESFPPGSFIDVSKFEDFNELKSYLKSIEYEEFNDRYRKCAEAFNLMTRLRLDSHRDYLDRVIGNIRKKSSF